MTVHCPHCSTGYLLPDHLMGPRGARVRCPQCKRPFVVLREESGGTITRLDDILPTESDLPADLGSAPDEEAARVAEELLDSLAHQLGRALVQARSRGRVLAEFGPDVMKAFDEYRSRLGERAAPAAFRAALKERWGVDLTT
jgi:predicted Zn finger-like uncharacterized protein